MRVVTLNFGTINSTSFKPDRFQLINNDNYKLHEQNKKKYKTNCKKKYVYLELILAAVFAVSWFGKYYFQFFFDKMECRIISRRK